MTTTIIRPGEIAKPGGEPPVFLSPDASVFADRGRRLRVLAEGHGMADWLRFMAALCDQQQAMLQQMPELDLAGALELARARNHGMPPLAPLGWPRPAAWRDGLRCMAEVLGGMLPASGQGALRAVPDLGDAVIEQTADALLAHELPPEAFPQAALPFVAAALQVLWTARARELPADLPRLEHRGLCPACGSLPVASVVRLRSDVSNLRYLHCSLCNSEWNLVRVTCAACESTDGVAYHHVEDRFPAVRAETCDRCHSYLKIFLQDKDPQVDPVADDLATLALDVLLDEAGYQRAGPNLLLFPGG